MRPKLDVLTLESQPYGILVFTETWLNPTVRDEDLAIPNFCLPYRLDRTDKPGGVLAIYVRKSLHSEIRSDLQVDGVEAIWVQVRVNQRKLLVGGIYRPPNANNAQWLNMEHCLDHVFNSACDNILVTGDFNVNIEAPSNKMSRRIILPTRLRLCCSSLNYDLYRHNLVESHHCDCGAVETPTHVLLSCCFRILD